MNPYPNPQQQPAPMYNNYQQGNPSSFVPPQQGAYQVQQPQYGYPQQYASPVYMEQQQQPAYVQQPSQQVANDSNILSASEPEQEAKKTKSNTTPSVVKTANNVAKDIHQAEKMTKKVNQVSKMSAGRLLKRLLNKLLK